MQSLQDIIKKQTRESWMNAASEWLLDEVIMPVVTGYDKPNIKCSIGFPFRSSKAIGQCFTKGSSAGGYNEIFINPKMSGLDTIRVLDILAHELIHAIDNCESGHKGFFAKTARAIGLEGKLTATVAGEALKERLNTLLVILGDIPHAGMDTGKSTIKKQGTRMIKIECGACGFIARTASKWADQLPELAHCPVCLEQELNVAD